MENSARAYRYEYPGVYLLAGSPPPRAGPPFLYRAVLSYLPKFVNGPSLGLWI